MGSDIPSGEGVVRHAGIRDDMTMFPDLSGAKFIGFDTETKDPELTTKGPGHYRKDSYLVGISLATEDGFKAYYPIRHEGGGNLPEDKVLSYVKDQLGHDAPIKVGANLTYDMLYLRKEGIEVVGRTRDVQIAEPLIDENSRQYSLGALAKKYLNDSKSDDALNAWCAMKFGGRATRRAQAGNYWRVPASVIREYAEDDARLPIEIWNKQYDIIKSDNLEAIFGLETRLQRALIEMRHQGVRVDTRGAEVLADDWRHECRVMQAQLNLKAGMHVDVWAAESLARAYDKVGVSYPRTAKTKAPSFTKAFLEHLHSIGEPLSYFILRVRALDKILSTFVEGGVLDKAENGWIHGEYHQLPTDENGAVTGRLSSSNPNLQNLPSRDSDLAPQVRGLFIPRDDELWYKYDYSQIEPRLTLSYSRGDVAEQIIAAYQKDPTMDCYNAMLDKMQGVSRFQVKVLYLGMTYYMGKDKLAAQLGVDSGEAEEIFNMFHAGAPYISELRKRVGAKAANAGEVVSLLGRKHRFNKWESREWREEGEEYLPALDRAEALAAYRHIKRAFTYKALNRLIQGGAATVLKKAIVDCYESGVWEVTGPPFLNVHDELDHSIPQTKEGEQAAKEIHYLMENTIKTKVPFKVDVETGPDWGHVK